MNRLAVLLAFVLLALSCAGCASVPPPPPVTVSGNGNCHPSDDLPPSKTVPAAPEADTTLTAFLQWVIGERKAHGQDVRDYNSLYRECVNGQ